MKTNFPYKNILIVCSVNTARSPMAVGFLKNLFSKYNLDINVMSGGISSNARDGMLISLDAKLAMKEIGIDLPDNSLSIDLKRHPNLIYDSDLILTLTQNHSEEIQKYVKKSNKVIVTLKEFAGDSGDIEDPSMKELRGFRVARDEIIDCLLKGLKNYIEDL
ncbi:MAG: low molecular weight protein arginine phosphatase [Candidatus Heimdallarchaeota archaeon]